MARLIGAADNLGRRSAVPVDINVRIDGRLPEPVEVGAYYVASEMITNAAKHARASVVAVRRGSLRRHAPAAGTRDDGIGGADPLRGSGLTGLKDRIEALGGVFSLHSPEGGGTVVSCELPVPADGPRPGYGSWPGPRDPQAARVIRDELPDTAIIVLSAHVEVNEAMGPAGER